MSILESLGRILDNMEDKIVEEEVLITKQDQEADEAIKKLLIADKDKDVITEEIIEEGKKDPKAKVRTKPDPVFDDKSSKITDDKDHFPLGSIAQARNALARAGAFTKPPKWYKGSLSSFKSAVKKAVKKAYPDIKIAKD